MSQLRTDILADGIGSIHLIDWMGGDLSIVNAARVSYNKQKEVLDLADEKLIKYLITHKHWSPFRGVVFTFRVQTPLFIARQWWKHVVASSYIDSQTQWNEVSLRYTDASEFQYYLPKRFRTQAQNN